MEGLFSLLPMLLIFALMYFMLIKPQKKAAETKAKMLEAIKPGDGVVTIGGLHGVVDEVDRQAGIVVLDCEGIFLTFELHAIANVKSSAPATSEPIETEEVVVEESPVAPVAESHTEA